MGNIFEPKLVKNFINCTGQIVKKSPAISSFEVEKFDDSVLKTASDSVTGISKALINLQKTPKTKPLPILTLDENLTRKEVYKKRSEFESFVKKNLSKEQRIVKDEYSSSELRGKLYTVDEFIHSDKGFTDSICDCICVLIHDCDDAYLFHLCPGKHAEIKAINRMKEKIGSVVDGFKTKTGDCKVFLFGGRKDESENLYSNIFDVLNSKGIKPDEILFDKEKSPHSFYFDVKKGIILDKFCIDDKESAKNGFERVNLTGENKFLAI